jgi:hypothetical protein
MSAIDSRGIQIQFLNRIQDVIPPDTSLVMELSDLLNISTDSAYRRMRGETMLSIEEIIILCDTFQISFDAISRKEAGLVTFKYSTIDSTRESFVGYLQNIYNDLLSIKRAPNSQIIYASGDMPVFHHYSDLPIAAFKMFYWMRSIMNIPELENTHFHINCIDEELKVLSKKIIDLYLQIPSVEIWTDTTIHSTLKQIEYYWESGMFENKKQATEVCDSLKNVITSIRNMAETSDKTQQRNSEKNYELYFSDIEITNNCVLVNMNIAKAVYLGHFSFYTMSTLNDAYCEKTAEWLHSLIKRSTLISGIAEKQRYQFFRKIFAMIDELKNKIENGN